MFHVRTMKPKDFSFGVSLANTMNWNMTLADFEFNRKLEPNGCFVLLEDSQPVGLATCISYGQVGWFGNLVVKDTYRKHGAGTHLVQHAVRYLKNAGATTIGLYAYPHLSDFYGKIGFKRDTDFLVLKTDAVLSLPASGGDLRQTRVLDLPTIVTFDEGCFGASRRKLLGEILKNPDNLTYIATEESETFGFGAAKVYGEAAEIGPLACKAGDPQVATDLLRAILRKLEGFEAYVYLPAAETILLDEAFKAGFKEEFRLNRMFFGPAVAKTCIYLAESLERG
jgi:predicted GNAT family acetyltransferase